MSSTGARWLTGLLALLAVVFVIAAAVLFSSSHPRRGALSVVLAVVCALGGLFVWVRSRSQAQ